jgi:transposase-like protein
VAWCIKEANKVETQLASLQCPACDNQEVIKSGKRHNLRSVQQRYQCKVCGITFSERGYYGFKAKYALSEKHYAIELYKQGYSMRGVTKLIREELGLTVSATSILHWLHRAGVETRDSQHKTKKKEYREFVKVSVLVRICSSEYPDKLLMMSDEYSFKGT